MGPILGFIILALLVVGFAKRDEIEAILRRFDEKNRDKTRRLIAAKRTPHAHMALTIEEIASRTEPVETIWANDPATGKMTRRYLWRGETYDREEDANAAREHVILTEARGFYKDLDQQLLR